MIQTFKLSYAYPGSAPLHFPDLDVAQGSVVLLSGPSGCGKSTWLALVAGLVKPAAGSLQVADQAVGDLNGIASDAWRAKTIGFLPQKLHLSAALTVAQNLAMAQWAAGQHEDEDRIASTLKALLVADLAKRKPAQLSGGQAQRVALARAVLLQPKVILADEPTAALDTDNGKNVMILLKKLALENHSAILVVTHDHRMVEGFDRIFHVDDGRITGEMTNGQL